MTAKRKKPAPVLRTIPAWKRATFIDRALMCAGFLYCHDLLSDGERQKVHQRMKRMVEKAKP